MAEGYAKVIEAAELSAPLPALDLPSGRAGRVRIPMWCARTASGYYNDYHYGYAADARLVEIADRADGEAIDTSRIRDIATEEDVRRWISVGHLVACR